MINIFYLLIDKNYGTSFKQEVFYFKNIYIIWIHQRLQAC